MGVIGKINAEGTTHLIAPTVYGTCSTAAATAAKTVTIDGFTLMTGITIWVKFTNSNTANNPTLSINNGTAIPIKMAGTSAAGTTPTTSWYGGSVVALTYDGTNWLIDNYKQDTNTINTLQNGIYFPVGEGGVQNYSLCMKTSNLNGVPKYSSFTTTSGTGTSKTVNTTGFIPSTIYYNPNNTAYASGGETGDIQTACAIDARYSFNITASSFTKGKPVYLVGTIGNDGLFYLDSTPWTQTEPQTEDGKYYIYIGMAYSGYQLYLSPENPLMKYYDGDGSSIPGGFMKVSELEGCMYFEVDHMHINNTFSMNNSASNSNITISSIYGLNTASHLNYDYSASSSSIPNVATLAFWNGRFNSVNSNLAYCNKGAFGNMATKNSVSQSDLVDDFLYGLVTQAEATLTAVNVAQNSWVSLGQVSLSKGKYIFIAKAQVELNTGTSYTTGYFSLGVVTGTTKTAHSKFDTKVNSDAWLITENVRTLTLTQNTTVSIFGYQTLVAGGSVGAKVTPSYSYIKLK